MSRSERNWPSGLRNCGKCGRGFKQLASLAAHSIKCKGKKAELKRSRYPKEFQALIDEKDGLGPFLDRPAILKLARRLLEEHNILMSSIETHRSASSTILDPVHVWSGKDEKGLSYASTDTVTECVKAKTLKLRPSSIDSREEGRRLIYVDAVRAD